MRRSSSRWAPASPTSTSASASPAPATSTPCTPRSTGCRSTCACPCPTASTRATPRSPRWAPSPCRACARARWRSARPPWSSASASSARSSCSCCGPTACRCIGIDLSDARCKMAEGSGAVCADAPDGAGLDRIVASLAEVSGGFGADAVFLAAGGRRNDPVELAAKLARDRGRVVDIGKCSLDLPWNAYYEKELDVRFSRSYGPGRYDTLYEEQGIDYPIGYVRWSEGRNLGCFVDLLAEGSIDMEPLISAVKPFAEAQETYEKLDAGELQGIGFLFEYPEHVTITRRHRARRGRHRGEAVVDRHGAHRLRRRRQLRLDDAAAPPAGPQRRDPAARGHVVGPVGRERPAQVRLPDRRHRLQGHAGRHGHRRRVRRDPALDRTRRWCARRCAPARRCSSRSRWPSPTSSSRW